jgi:hypothetical protein
VTLFFQGYNEASEVNLLAVSGSAVIVQVLAIASCPVY